MKILALNWRDITHPRAGGAETNVHEILKRLIKKKHKVTLFCGYYQGSKRYDKIDGIEIIRAGNIATVYLLAIFFYFTKFRKENYDLIFENISGTPWMTMLYSRKPRIAIIYHIVGDIFFKEIPFLIALIAYFIESSIMPIFYKNTKVLAISKSEKGDLIDLGFKNLDIINLGLDKKLRPNNKIRSKSPIILHVGRLMYYKRVDILINLMKDVVKQVKDAKLYIVGRGESKESLESLVSELGLNNNVKFFGFVSEKKKLELLQNSWVFVTPSYKEGWGIVVLEANACGVPAISFNVSGLKSSIVNNKTGYLVETEEDMLKKIITLIKDKKLRTKMSKQSIEWSKNFDWNKTTNKFIDVIKHL
jgi:glycosyltransferase involved in cell wall biosynthesis